MDKFVVQCKDNDEKSELLVFGYGCTLFNRQDDFNENWSKYLIPLNGDENIKVDRYDCRLYLDDFDGPSNALKSDYDAEDSAELLEEELCDEERFKDLPLFDESNYLGGSGDALAIADQRTGATFSFNYGGAYDSLSEVKPKNIFGSSFDSVDDCKSYETPTNLKLPPGIIKPETAKQGMIIEKTALFSVKNGAQMEVVLKAKFGSSDLFGFLDFDHILHSFYKYICKQVRENKYTPNFVYKAENDRESDYDSDSSEGCDLHPLLTMRKDTVSKFGGSKVFGPEEKPKIVPKKQVHVDIDALVQHFHTTEKKSALYESLMSGLTNVIPGSIKLLKDPTPKSEVIKSVKDPFEFETDMQVIESYNTWHMGFYGYPSPYLPGSTPKIRPVPPDLSASVLLAARYVAINGSSAEKKLIQHNGELVEFLFPISPYHTFYQSRIRAIQQTLLYHQSQNMTISQIQQAPSDCDNLGSTSNLDLSSNAQHRSNGSSRVPLEISTHNESALFEDISAELLDPKQKERREKARLFMEKILNEKLTGKKRRTGKESPPSGASDTDDFECTSSVSIVIPDDIISNLVDKQLNFALKTHSNSPSSSSRHSRTRKRSRSRSRSRRRSRSHESFRKRHRIKNRSKKSSRSRTSEKRHRNKKSESKSNTKSRSRSR